MESRVFLLLVLVLLIFMDHSQGVPETHEQSLIVNTFTDASDVGKPLTAINPINTPRQHNRPCNCKGKGRGMVSAPCLCQQPARRKQRKLKRWCQREQNMKLKRCSLFSKSKKGVNKRKFGPSVPM